jgi:hypothetical protein
MKRLLLATTALIVLAAATPASATILLDTNGQGGTGNNVIFSSIFNSQLILGKLNGQNDEVVRFFDRSATGGFTGAANGNDIKINHTADLDITVFDKTNFTQLAVTRDVFSIVGEGTLTITAKALEADGSFQDFTFTQLLKNGQNGFDLTAVDGERIWDVDLKMSAGGTITDFEHFRIDVAPQVAAVPEASTWFMMIVGFLSVGLIGMRKKATGSFRVA